VQDVYGRNGIFRDAVIPCDVIGVQKPQWEACSRSLPGLEIPRFFCARHKEVALRESMLLDGDHRVPAGNARCPLHRNLVTNILRKNPAAEHQALAARTQQLASKRSQP
jgi:hypothetical protein